MACGIFPDQGLNLCTLHWQVDSQPLDHQRSPYMYIYPFITPCPRISYLASVWPYPNHFGGKKKRHSAHSYMQNYIIPIIVCLSINSFKRVDLKTVVFGLLQVPKTLWDFPGQNYTSNNATTLFICLFHSHPHNSVQENFQRLLDVWWCHCSDS